MAANLDLLFPGMEIDGCELFRVTRNANTESEEEVADDLLSMIETELRERQFAPIVRLEVAKGMDPIHRGMLAAELGLDEVSDVTEVDGMLGMRDLMQIASLPVPDLKDAKARPGRVAGAGLRSQHLPHRAGRGLAAAAPPLRVLQRLRRALPARGRGRPEGPRHQDDDLSDVRRLRDRRAP